MCYIMKYVVCNSAGKQDVSDYKHKLLNYISISFFFFLNKVRAINYILVRDNDKVMFYICIYKCICVYACCIPRQQNAGGSF